MNKTIFSIIVFISNFSFCQSIYDNKGIFNGLPKDEWEKINIILSSEVNDSIAKITPVELLRYLISDSNYSNSMDKSIRFEFPKSWITKKDVENLLPYIYSTKTSRKIHFYWAATASLKNSTLGFEIMHLINLYRFQNYHYPELCFICNAKSQKDMTEEINKWWNEYKTKH